MNAWVMFMEDLGQNVMLTVGGWRPGGWTGGRHMMVQHLALCVGKLAAKPALSTKPFT